MASVEGGSGDPTGKSRRNFLTGLGKGPSDTWLRRNWQTAVILVLVVLLAFFVRSYFVLGPSIDNGYLVSGGSDSYYHERVIDYVAETGHHLYSDPLLNYPWNMRNPRPPLFDWSVAVTGMTLAGITGSAVSDGTGFVLVTSTAFWGALTVIPVYLIGRQAFGRKVGLAAGFLFSIMPGHIERSVASQADHDAMVLFLVVLGFYFLLMSLKSINGTKWVSSWKSRGSVFSGLKQYVSLNNVSMVYAALAGVCVAGVAFIWTGYMYILIIVLVYFLIQVLINRFRNIDSFGVWMSIAIMLGLAFVLIMPLYYVMDYWATWFDVPLLLFLAMMFVGGVFVVTRDLPWTLVVPAFALFVIAALAAVAYISPNLFDAIITGQGYLVKSKLYSTISEAQSPNFSTLAMSFGIATFWLCLTGIGYALTKMIKNLSAYFVFLVVWTATAVFMAASAGRFLFNAAPAFAIMSGWVLVLIVDMVRFQDYPKGLSTARPWKAPFAWFRSIFRVKYVMAVFFVLLLVIIPNAWGAMDASIPSEYKKSYDLQIYNAMPSELRPTDYDTVNGSNWYFGAFGYSLPLSSQYFPAAWDWYSNQDTNLPVTDRPAFLSWWDYGFEAIQAGRHPAVADNFQNGFQFAGNYITCTDETQAIAMLVTRCIENRDISDGSAISNAMASYGVDMAKLRDILKNPSSYIPVVLAKPDVYGNFSQDLSATNAKYIASRVEIAKIGEEQCASLYNAIRSITGEDIGYFAIDTRLFPFSATGYNIFYAPAKLSDHIVSSVGNSPVDFFTIYATVITKDNVEETIPLDEVTSSMTVLDYSIQYTALFYETMLYRAFMGFGPYDIGYTEQGIPGFSGSLSSLSPMQAWNQTHFRLVYKTAYYNPYPKDMVANHTNAWMAISYDEALVLAEKIAAGEAIGVVDTSAYGLASGVVFVQYYDGAIVEGQVTTESGLPYPDVWVTVYDEYGTPHDYVKTDAEGRYSLIAPFGDLKIVYSTGTLDKRTLMGANELSTRSLTVTYAQAMRQTDYHINGDMAVSTYNLKGRVYWDVDGDGAYTSGEDSLITGATVVVENKDSGFKIEAPVSAGSYVVAEVPAIEAQVYAVIGGHSTTAQSVEISSSADTTVDIAIRPATVGGTVQYSDGSYAADFKLELLDLTNGSTMYRTTDSNGAFSFDELVYGEYELQSSVSGTTFGPLGYKLVEGAAINATIIVKEAMMVSGQAWISTGVVAANATIAIYNDDLSVVMRADSTGRYSLILPAAVYSVHIMANLDGSDFAVLTRLPGSSGTITFNPLLVPASYVSGKVQGVADVSGLTLRFESRTNGAVLSVVTNSTGQFRVLIPNDLYFIYNGQGGGAYWGDVTVTGSGPVTLTLVTSSTISGIVWYDADGDSIKDTAEGLEGITVAVSDTDGRIITVTTGIGGGYEIQLAPGKTYYSSIEQAGYFPYSKTFQQLSGSVTENVQLVALNRTVTGVVTFASATMPGITISFEATGHGAISLNTTTGAGGHFAVSLKPGTYDVLVDQEVVSGSNVSMYQYEGTLSVEVGEDPAALGIVLVKRYLVTGTITPYRSAEAKLTISGPDDITLQTTGNFTLYLQEGDYNFYALIQRLGSRWATLVNGTVTPGSNHLELTNVVAYFVQGTVKRDGTAITGTAPVTLNLTGGGSLSLTTSVAGSFTTYLPGGDYNASVDFRTKATILTKDRYVRYTGSLGFALSSTKVITIPVQRELDNTTLSGSVRVSGASVAATLEFIPGSTTSIWTNASATASGYTVSLAPGNYSIYVKEISGPSVYLGTVDVLPYVTNLLDINLVPGLRYFGTTQLAGTPGSAWLEFSGQHYKGLQSGADGSFEVYLPADTYTVQGTADGSERGVAVTYEIKYQLSLQESQSATVNLVKTADYALDLQWDSTEKRTIEAGQNVSYNLRVVNKGNSLDTITLSTSSLASGWSVSFSQNPVTVDFGSANSQLVTVTITTPASAKVSHTVITIKGQSSHSTESDTVTMDVGIVPRYSVSLKYAEALESDGTEYIYDLTVTNAGNIDDNYNVTVTNLADLATWGWSAQVRLTSGSWSDHFLTTLSAGSSTGFELRLVPTRANPESNVTVVLYAVSIASPDIFTVLQLDPVMPEFSIPGGVTVSGQGVSTSSPQLPTSTVVLLGLMVAMATILVLLIIQKGVLRRRKR